ncbi:hypothetical protein [Nitrospira sp. Kam-Ns4a]
MSNLQTYFQWATHYPFAAAALFFGGTAVAITLYTYLNDFRRLQGRSSEVRPPEGGDRGSGSEDLTRQRRLR